MDDTTQKDDTSEEQKPKKLLRNKMVDLGPMFARNARKSAFERGAAIVTYHKDGTHTIELPPGVTQADVMKRGYL